MSFAHAANLLRAGAVGAAIAAAFGAGAQAEPETLLRAAHAASTSNTGHKALEFMDKQLREETDGRIGLEIFPNAQLGGERELIENIQFGNVDLVFVSSAPLASFNAQFYAFDIPFLFKDRAQAYSVLDGEIGQELLASLEDVGMVGLGYWENGFRQLTNAAQEIRTPADLDGMKMRTMENEVHIALWREEGANPAPLAFNELFTALQQGTFDAQEGPINLFYDMKFYEVQDFITKTNHIYSPWPILANPEALSRLSDEDREAFDAAVADATEYQRALAKEADDKAEEAMDGVTVTTLSDDEKQAFVEAAKPTIELVKEKAGADLVERIMDAAAKD